MTNIGKVTLAGLLAMVLGTAWSQEESASGQRGSLEVKTVVQKLSETVNENGEAQTELVEIDTAVPGDQVVYTVTFRNIGVEPAQNIRITNPIPEQMRYVSGTAFGPGSDIEYSADGGETWGQPALLRVQDESGIERLAEASDFTHIRWALNAPLAAGEGSFARFRAIIR